MQLDIMTDIIDCSGFFKLYNLQKSKFEFKKEDQLCFYVKNSTLGVFENPYTNFQTCQDFTSKFGPKFDGGGTKIGKMWRGVWGFQQPHYQNGKISRSTIQKKTLWAGIKPF